MIAKKIWVCVEKKLVKNSKCFKSISIERKVKPYDLHILKYYKVCSLSKKSVSVFIREPKTFDTFCMQKKHEKDHSGKIINT